MLPGNLVRETLKYDNGVLAIEGKTYNLGDYREVHLFGSGKASVETARAVKAVLGDEGGGGPRRLQLRRRDRRDRGLYELPPGPDGKEHPGPRRSS